MKVIGIKLYHLDIETALVNVHVVKSNAFPNIFLTEKALSGIFLYFDIKY